MKAKLMKFLDQLSRDEMRTVTGAGSYCSCHCYSNPGSWTGYYSSSQAIANAVNNYCSGGGTCQC